MSTTRKKIDPSFKEEAIGLAEKSDKPDRQIEKDLGIYQGALRQWRKDLQLKGEGAFNGTSRIDVLEKELRRVKKERDNAVMERDILKKAVAIFSQPRKTGIDS
jgi:transposase